MANALRLFGLRSVVTGAASGIGEAIVRTLVKHGSEVLALDSANSGIENHFASVRGVHGAVADINSADVAARIGELAADALGVVDIVVCNFNLFGDAPISDKDDDALLRIVKRQNTLVEGICEQLLPMMQSSPAGRIIILGLNRAVFSQDGLESYARSESAMAETTRRLAADNADVGINVNYIQPGAVMTPESRRVFNNDKALRDYCIQRSAAKRLGEPVDIAKVALFLATDDSVFVSGTGIVADGGIAADK
jgi:NAD(P)-dependent dehydrogenase (short-subunit alcohol dehydrogenase family)